MKPIEFCYWIQGFSEITGCEHPTVPQWEIVINNLKDTTHSENEAASCGLQPSNFITWLKGYVEISQVGAPNEREWAIINEHLKLVFVKVTPTVKKESSEKNKTFEDTVKDNPEKYNPEKYNPQPTTPWPRLPDRFCSTPPATGTAFICTASKEELPGS